MSQQPTSAAGLAPGSYAEAVAGRGVTAWLEARPATPAAVPSRLIPMPWTVSHRFSRRGCELADRHYSRQKPGTPQFVATGKPLVLLAEGNGSRALWVSLYQLPQYTKHAWPGAWCCSLFRNEGVGLSSDLIRTAVAATRFAWGPPPPLGFITFVNPGMVRHKRDPGRCYAKAGWRHIASLLSERKLVFQLPRDEFPTPVPARGQQREMFQAVG